MDADFGVEFIIEKGMGIETGLGFGKRAIFIIDKKGIIRYIDIPHELNEGPPDEDKIFKTLEELQY